MIKSKLTSATWGAGDVALPTSFEDLPAWRAAAERPRVEGAAAPRHHVPSDRSLSKRERGSESAAWGAMRGDAHSDGFTARLRAAAPAAGVGAADDDDGWGHPEPPMDAATSLVLHRALRGLDALHSRADGRAEARADAALPLTAAAAARAGLRLRAPPPTPVE